MSIAENDQRLPAVAFDGVNSFVVWDDHWGGGAPDIFGARVTTNGVVIDASRIAVSMAAGIQREPAVAFNGSDYFVVWQDSGEGPNSDLVGAVVTCGGVVHEIGLVVGQEGDQQSPSLARGPDDRLFLVYQGWARRVGDKSYNADRVWGKMHPVPGVEERHGQTANSQEPMATIVRGVLWLAPLPFPLPEGEGGGAGHDRNPGDITEIRPRISDCVPLSWCFGSCPRSCWTRRGAG